MQALEGARDAGEIPPMVSPGQLARFLVVMLQGLHVYAGPSQIPRGTRCHSRSLCQLSACPDPWHSRSRRKRQQHCERQGRPKTRASGHEAGPTSGEANQLLDLTAPRRPGR